MAKKKKSRIKVRRQWKIKPVTKLKESAKVYRRPIEKRALRKDLHEL